MVLMKKCVLSLNKKNNNIGFPTFKLPPSTLTIFNDYPLNISLAIFLVYD